MENKTEFNADSTIKLLIVDIDGTQDTTALSKAVVKKFKKAVDIISISSKALEADKMTTTMDAATTVVIVSESSAAVSALVHVCAGYAAMPKMVVWGSDQGLSPLGVATHDDIADIVGAVK